MHEEVLPLFEDTAQKMIEVVCSTPLYARVLGHARHVLTRVLGHARYALTRVLGHALGCDPMRVARY